MKSSADNIGKVKITKLKEYNKAVYSDGDVEDWLLELYKKGLKKSEKEKILSKNPSWPVRYHLANERANLVNWYNFSPNSRILEVGSGCGAITEELVKNKNSTIVANELSEKRASINAYRNRKSENLEIIIGNLNDYRPSEGFDYVICVGVLEYAGTFIEGEDKDPYILFVERLSEFLKPGGTLLLAIENRMGFKYFAGAREDHTGGYFDGINNYPQEKKVKTFGKKQLTTLLNRAGLDIELFYYPHPDYKLTKTVFSDEYLPGKNATLPKNLLPSPSFDQSRQFLFSEQLFVDALERNGLYDSFANSFLVEATKGKNKKRIQEDRIVFARPSDGRNKKYSIMTTAIKNAEELTFCKRNLFIEGQEHVEKMTKTYDILKKKVNECKWLDIVPPQYNREKHSIYFDHIKGVSLESKLLEHLLDDDMHNFYNLIKKYKSALKEFSNHVNTNDYRPHNRALLSDKEAGFYSGEYINNEGILDFNPDNFIIEEKTEKWWLIDYEWRLDKSLPTEFIEYRGLLSFFSRHKEIVESRSNHQKIIKNRVMALPKRIIKDLSYNIETFKKTYEIEELIVQESISNRNKKFITFDKFSDAQPIGFYLESIDRVLYENNQSIISITNQLNDKEIRVNELQKEINNLKNSRFYYLYNIALKIRRKLNRFSIK